MSSLPASLPLSSNKKRGMFADFPKIAHQAFVTKAMEALYDNGLNSDVTFLVDERQFKAHRAILAVQSPVFAKMLLDKSFREASNVDEMIALPDKRGAPFDIFLRYVYTGSVDLAELDLETLLEVLLIAHEYQFTELVASISSTLMQKISMESVFQIFEAALLLNLEKLLDECHDFFFVNADVVLKDAQFVDLSKAALIDLIASDNFYAPEIDILLAVCCWSGKNKGANLHEVLQQVRFEHVTLDGMSMARIAPLFEFLNDNKIDLNLLGCNPSGSSEKTSPKRETAEERNNVAKLESGASIVEGIVSSNSRFFFQPNESASYLGSGNSVVVNLGRCIIVSSVSFYILSAIGTSCSYKLETSFDKKRWNVLADCQLLQCARRQQIIFSPRKFQYIKLTGEANRQNVSSYCVWSFHCADETVTAVDRLRYMDVCPNGGTLVRQINNAGVISSEIILPSQ